MAQIVKRAYRYRCYPTPEQAAELARTFGCVRLVYNKALEERTHAYIGQGRSLSYVEFSAALTRWKRTEEIRSLDPVESVVGVDAGITALVPLSTGEKIVDPRHERADRRRLAKAQQALAR